MYENNRKLLGFSDLAKGNSRVRGRSLEICRLDFRFELLGRFSGVARDQNAFGGAPAGGGFGRGARDRGSEFWGWFLRRAGSLDLGNHDLGFGGWLDPHAVVVDVGVGVCGLDDVASGYVDAISLFDDVA